MPTDKTSKLSPDQELEILQQAILRCQQAGIKAVASNFYDAGNVRTVIILDGVIVQDGNLILASKVNDHE